MLPSQDIKSVVLYCNVDNVDNADNVESLSSWRCKKYSAFSIIVGHYVWIRESTTLIVHCAILYCSVIILSLPKKIGSKETVQWI